MRHVMRLTIAGQPWLIEVTPRENPDDDLADDGDYAVDRDARHLTVRYSSSPFQLLATAFAAAELIRAPEAA